MARHRAGVRRVGFFFLAIGPQSRLWGLAYRYRIGRPKGSGKSLDKNGNGIR